MGFVAFSSRRSRLSSDVCYDTCPARGGLPLRPSPSDRSSIELGSQLVARSDTTGDPKRTSQIVFP